MFFPITWSAIFSIQISSKSANVHNKFNNKKLIITKTSINCYFYGFIVYPATRGTTARVIDHQHGDHYLCGPGQLPPKRLLQDDTHIKINS